MFTLSVVSKFLAVAHARAVRHAINSCRQRDGVHVPNAYLLVLLRLLCGLHVDFYGASIAWQAQNCSLILGASR